MRVPDLIVSPPASDPLNWTVDDIRAFAATLDQDYFGASHESIGPARAAAHAEAKVQEIVTQMRSCIADPDGSCGIGSNRWFTRAYLGDAAARLRHVRSCATATHVG